MDIRTNEQKIANVEMANFVLLSLYREYSIHLLNNSADKQSCINKMRQIKHDMRYLTSDELITKVQKLYLPVLQKIGK